jgi:hypothetical protein
MNKWGKLHSNLWIKIADDNFDKLLQIQKDYDLNSIEEVLALLINTRTINSLAKESAEFAKRRNDKLQSRAS